jgi:uncharacterized protein (DUF433 family)
LCRERGLWQAERELRPVIRQNIHPRFVERALEPRYGFPEAAHLVGRPRPTLRRWALGNKRTYRDQPTLDEPLIRVDGSPEPGELPLSFLNLLELRFLASYRKAATLPAIRRALDYAAEALKVERPLLQAEFAVHGRELFLRYAEDEWSYVNASRRGQMAWPSAAEHLFESLDYDETEHAAYRWWPLGKDRPVMVDTRVNGGHPSTAGSAVRTLAIAARARRGWSSESIAEDVAASREEIGAALEFEDAA